MAGSNIQPLNGKLTLKRKPVDEFGKAHRQLPKLTLEWEASPSLNFCGNDQNVYFMPSFDESDDSFKRGNRVTALDDPETRRLYDTSPQASSAYSSALASIRVLKSQGYAVYVVTSDSPAVTSYINGEIQGAEKLECNDSGIIAVIPSRILATVEGYPYSGGAYHKALKLIIRGDKKVVKFNLMGCRSLYDNKELNALATFLFHVLSLLYYVETWVKPVAGAEITISSKSLKQKPAKQTKNTQQESWV